MVLTAMALASDDDTLQDLGDAMSEGRRGKSQATIRRTGRTGGAMTASGGFGITGNFLGNFEEATEESELGEEGFVSTHASKSTFPWEECKSEGGSKKCALCDGDDGGALPCSKVEKSGEDWQQKYQSFANGCPDRLVAKNMKFFYQNDSPEKANPKIPKPYGFCMVFPTDDTRPSPAHRGVSYFTQRFPDLGDAAVVTKAISTHPHRAKRNIGIVAFKRIVLHRCTGKGKANACTTGQWVADTYKASWCVKCKKDIFKHVAGHYATDEEQRNFNKNCLKHAIDDRGNVRSDYKCEGTDSESASFFAANF